MKKKKKIFDNFKTYEKFFKDLGIIIDHNKRKKTIEQNFTRILKKRKLTIKYNSRLLNEVVNLVESPNILLCKFDRKFLTIPKEILTLTMESHQRYFPTFDEKNEITNEFLIVSNRKDKKGLIKLGNERVIDARLNDAEFFGIKIKNKILLKKYQN